MNTQPTTSSFIVRAAVLLLTVLTTTGSWAQSPTTVTTEKQLTDAIANGANIQLAGDIQLSKYLDIDGKTVTIDLNGHKLYRNHTEHNSAGHVIYAHGGCNLTLMSSVDGGSIEGGKANNGGAINIPHGNTVSATNVIFQNNSAADHAGAIWNNGTFTATNSSFTNNTANDVGAIYNAVQTEGANTYAGTASLTGCTFTGNKGATGAGALANALGATVMTIDGCTIMGNTADTRGGGIWNGGTLNMQGKVIVKDNAKAGGVVSNVYLKRGKVITVTGSLTGSNIGVDLESISGLFTSGYKTYHNGVVPSTFFTVDHSDVVSVELDENGEACLISNSAAPVSYIERSWDETNKEVVSTEKRLKGVMIGYDATPVEGQYKEVTSAADNEWFGMGGYSTSVPEFYVVRGNVYRETVVVQGKNVHLILCDGAMLHLTGGLKVEDDNKLYIHSQSYGDDMGKLIVTNRYKNAAGIGSALHNGHNKPMGELVIYGGHIEATGGGYGAGIGSCKRTSESGTPQELCKPVTVYGGYVKAKGGNNAAGIGGGGTDNTQSVKGGIFTMYDGTVIAEGGIYAAGLGGGGCYSNLGLIRYHGGDGGNVTVYGGTLTATGGQHAAGIGSGSMTMDETKNTSYTEIRHGGTFRSYGGTVTANGGEYAAGIGGGICAGGADVYVYGGTVTANGGEYAAGIGGGWYAMGFTYYMSGGTVTANGGEEGAGIGSGSQTKGNGGNVTIAGGTLTANGGEKAAGIGGGWLGDGGSVTITGGTVIAKAGSQGGAYNRAIGPGYKDDGYRTPSKFGSLVIGDAMMVGAGNNGSVERIYDADERVNACWYRSYAELSPCTHTGATYTVNGTDANGTHTMHCSHCTTEFVAEPHDFDENGECGVCHFKGTVYTVTIYLPDANDDDTYTTDGVYKSYTYDMVSGTSFTLPGAPQDLQNMEFAGWLITTTEGAPTFSSYRATDDETLQAEGAPYTLNGNVTFIARYKDIAISLADDGDNHETIYNYDGKVASSVTLTGRIFHKDGNWNTLCLPFAVTDGDSTDGVTFSGTPLEGATVLTLDNATFENSTLTFNFEETTVIEPGKPYLVKWAKDGEHPTIVNPVFHGVTISNTSTYEKAVSAGIVSFTGQYGPMKIGEEGNITVLYLSADNTFRYPNGAMDINAFRAYIYANASLGDVNDDGAVNVTDVTMLVNHILGINDESFVIENADVTRDGDITVTDVTALVNLILGGNSIVKMVVNGADGITFGGGGNEPARVAGTTYQDD